ncbi:hypothetical protein B0T18DRAFT_61482 [Schizothecium vesticola]|uniref:Uncharacterized protein n=1 Tax=Schizothecium vesticola TaxID=314040 RepID=A0AA40KA57_9PEZI|nr:hypothetical protein B0T18DRAFT_61482 [Schizothecium vesticola]
MGHGWAKAKDDAAGDRVHGGTRPAGSIAFSGFSGSFISPSVADDTNEPATTLLARTRQLHADMDGRPRASKEEQPRRAKNRGRGRGFGPSHKSSPPKADGRTRRRPTPRRHLHTTITYTAQTVQFLCYQHGGMVVLASFFSRSCNPLDFWFVRFFAGSRVGLRGGDHRTLGWLALCLAHLGLLMREFLSLSRFSCSLMIPGVDRQIGRQVGRQMNCIFLFKQHRASVKGVSVKVFTNRVCVYSCL